MTGTEIEDAVRKWVGSASVDPDVGVPPDAKVKIHASLLTTLGHISEGQTEPSTGCDIWLVDLTVFFPGDQTSAEGLNDSGQEVATVLTRLRASLEADPSIVAEGLRVRWSQEAEVSTSAGFVTPDGYALAVGIGLAATVC